MGALSIGQERIPWSLAGGAGPTTLPQRGSLTQAEEERNRLDRFDSESVEQRGIMVLSESEAV